MYLTTILTIYLLFNIINLNQIHSIKPPLYKNIYTNLHPLQSTYDKYINNINIPLVIATGQAGTGKTSIACHAAIKLIDNPTTKYTKIVITRPYVSAMENIGYLPGNVYDKTVPYLIPIYEYFKDYYTATELKNLLKTGIIEIVPLGYMRGRTFKNTIIIADEMQNSLIEQMYLLMSRLGENSKLIITGDVYQSDIVPERENGLSWFLYYLFKKYNKENISESMLDLNVEQMNNDGIGYVHLNSECIKRHQLLHVINHILSPAFTSNINKVTHTNTNYICNLLKNTDDVAYTTTCFYKHHPRIEHKYNPAKKQQKIKYYDPLAFTDPDTDPDIFVNPNDKNMNDFTNKMNGNYGNYGDYSDYNDYYDENDIEYF